MYPPELPNWHENIEEYWRSSGAVTVNFEKIQHLFLVFNCWGEVLPAAFTSRDKRQIKITKHAGTGTNYAIITKRDKVQHEKKPVSNLKSMLIVRFEQTSTKFIDIFIL